MRSEQLVDQIDFQDNSETYSCHAKHAIRINGFGSAKGNTSYLAELGAKALSRNGIATVFKATC